MMRGLLFLILCFHLSWACSPRVEEKNPYFEENEGLLMFKGKVDSPLDSIEIHVNKETGKLVRILQRHAKDSLNIFSYDENHAFAMYEAMGFEGKRNKNGYRIYYDTTLRKESEGPIEAINLPYRRKKIEYYFDGKSIKYLHFMTNGVADSIVRFDSLSHRPNAIHIPEATAKKLRVEPGNYPVVSKIKKTD